MPRRGWNAADEAQFALLEPDGASPAKARRARGGGTSAASQKQKMYAAFGGIVILFIVGTHQSGHAQHAVSAAHIPASHVAAASDADVVVDSQA